MKTILKSSAIILLFINAYLPAQSMDQSFIIKGNLSLPLGQYAENDYSDHAGFANLGYGGGLEFESRFGISPVKWFISSDIIINYFDEDKFEDMIYETSGLLPSINSDPNINIPTFIGLKFVGELTPSIEFQISGGAGLNISYPSNYEITITNIPQSGTGNAKNDPTTSFGFKVGGSLVVNKIFFQFCYINLSEPSYNGYLYFPNGTKQKSDFKQPISMMLFSIGINIL
ncbi:MAG: hypothetical protein FD143_13 [Ignavibacteria bacterium]|nr:MAG: hypothetical protein FD143_13 [Ignavibacteria bacterium]KAF0158324.1 MAG: hypothetical protein FD188_2582 [Ignavibacteria bacterium]